MRESLRATEIATKASAEAAEAAKNQAALAADAFTKLERPYVYIFGVNRLEFDRNDSLSDTPHIKYTVANYGKTPANITILAAGISSFSDGPLDPLIVDYRDDPMHDLIIRPILPPGDIRPDIRVYAPDGIDFTMPSDEIVPQLKGADNLFVWIRIQYQGPFGDGYMTGACWRYDGLTNRLVQWGG